MKKKVLFIGLVWPEPEATAAGVRILQLIEFFLQSNHEIIFCSTAKKSALSYDLKNKGIKEEIIALNSDSFDAFISELAPDIVLFDRFLTEEQFGWKVEDNCPKALKILDTEDLHFLRKSRNSKEEVDYSQNDLAKREIASIYRCDLSLIISEYEMHLLREEFNIPSKLLFYIPFLEDSIALKNLTKYPSFSDREHFISIGNFKHEPNWKAVLKLKTEIWPLIRRSLPKAELHVYGAYASQKVFDLNNASQGFIVKGWGENIEEIYTNAKVCLAPLKFGAGIKGKLLNSMKYGTPNVTTTIGAEGMKLEGKWNGYIEDDPNEFSKKAVELYQNKANWEEFQKTGIELFNKRFSKVLFYEDFTKTLEKIASNLKAHRSENFIGAMLTYHHLRSTKFLSKYIEIKNKH